MTPKTQEPEMINDSPFYLAKLSHSLFVGLECREYLTLQIVYGFLNNQMGVKLRKHVAKTYPDEQTHYNNYLKILQRDEQKNAYFSIKYSLSTHGWGRINAYKSLSLSVFHRPTRHALSDDKYIDFDIVNAQIQILLCLQTNRGLSSKGLYEYCQDPKKSRYAIVEYYNLKDVKGDDGYILTAYEQAKKLPLRLAFGGGIRQWRDDYKVKECVEMPMIVNMMETMAQICSAICHANPHIRVDKYVNEEFRNKTKMEQDRSIMGSFAQTWERIIQEECIAHLVRTYPSVRLRDIVPCQDGFMPLKSQIKDVDIPTLFDQFNSIILKKYQMDIKWVVKPFDEKIEIPLSDFVPIHISLEDLAKGECHIATIISPALQDKLVYTKQGDKGYWWYMTERNTWVSSNHCNQYLITTTIQRYIEEERERILKQYHEEKDDKKREKIRKDTLGAVEKYYNAVGKSSYVGQVVKYLVDILVDNEFCSNFDKTGGKMVFADGIFDLKTGVFRLGFLRDDFIATTLSHRYLDVQKIDEKKMLYLRAVLKRILNNNDEHLEYYLGVIGHAMTGEAHLIKAIYYILDGTDNQKGDNGKTFLFGLLAHVFPEYVKNTDGKVFDDGYTKAHKSLITWKNARIVYIDEGSKNKPNDPLIKKIGDATPIEVEVMYGTIVMMVIMFKLFTCSNHLPRFGEEANAVYNRYLPMLLCSHFDRKGERLVENLDSLEFIADTTLPETLKKDYVNEIIALVLHYSRKFYTSGIPPLPELFKGVVEKTKAVNNDFACLLYEHFEFGCGKVSLRELSLVLHLQEDVIKKEMKKMNHKYDKDLSGLSIDGLKFFEKEGKKMSIKGGFLNFTRKVVEVVEEEEYVEE